MNHRIVITLVLMTALLPGDTTVVRASGNHAAVRVSLSTRPDQIRMGEPATMDLEVRDRENKRIRRLPIVHEKQMHLIVVPWDLSGLAHLHPDRDEDGRFSTTHVFPHGGRYRLYADMQAPDGKSVVVPFTLEVHGKKHPAPSLAEGLAQGHTSTAGGIRAERAAPSRVTSGRPIELGFELSDARTHGPVTDLQPYLGTMAHVIIISEDGKDFLHAHTVDGRTSAGHGGGHGHAMHGGHNGTSRTRGTMLNVHTTFPHPGLYRIWMQVQRDRRVITLPFVVRVEG